MKKGMTSWVIISLIMGLLLLVIVFMLISNSSDASAGILDNVFGFLS